MTDKYYLKKALDIMYNRRRLMLNDLSTTTVNIDYPDSETGRISQAVNEAKRKFLVAQEQYNDQDIKNLLGCD